MKNSQLVGGGIAMFAGAVFAQGSYDATVCDEQRFGNFTDPRVYLPNAWNDEKDEDGFICMSVDNSTPAFDVTWNWSTDIEDVHSFPYVRLNDDNLPTRLSGLHEIKLKVDWTMNYGTPSPPVRSFRQSSWDDSREELEEHNVQSNAAWDFFLDGNRTRTYNPVDADIEVMVWLGRVGDPYWLGRADNKHIGNVTLGDYDFGIYYDLNFRDRHVFSAIAESTTGILNFDEDLKPLFDYILENPEDIEDFPEDPWLGIVEFGSETWRSGGNVTFTAANFNMDLDADGHTPGDDEGSSGGGTSNGDDDSAAAVTALSAFGFAAPVAIMMGAVFA